MRFFNQLYEFMFAPASTHEPGLSTGYTNGIDETACALQIPFTNSATGLPMISGAGSVDVMGNPFGFELHNEPSSHQMLDMGIHDNGFSQCFSVPDMFVDQCCGHDSTVDFAFDACDS